MARRRRVAVQVKECITAHSDTERGGTVAERHSPEQGRSVASPAENAHSCRLLVAYQVELAGEDMHLACLGSHGNMWRAPAAY
jgi:hypothetical protein